MSVLIEILFLHVCTVVEDSAWPCCFQCGFVNSFVYSSSCSSSCFVLLCLFFFSILPLESNHRGIRVMTDSSEASSASPAEEGQLKSKISFSRLSLGATVEQFNIWDLRFQSAAIREKSELSSFFLPEANPETFATTRRLQSALFSSLLIACVNDDVLQHYRTQIDLKVKGLLLYQRLVKYFTRQREAEPSNEEKLLDFVRRPLPHAGGVDASLREAQDILSWFTNPSPVVERILLHHVLHLLSTLKSPWLVSVTTEFRSHLRESRIRDDCGVQVADDKTLSVLIEIVRRQLSITGGTSSSRSSGAGGDLKCTYCNRTNHTFERCWDRDPSLKRGKHKLGPVPPGAVRVRPYEQLE